MHPLTAVDLFAGAGGATQGLRDAGFTLAGAVEVDPDAGASYQLNHPSVRLWQSDIRHLPAEAMRRALGIKPGALTLLKACPPCQGFSTLAGGRVSTDDDRNDLVGHTVRFVRAFRPRAVLLENVPGLARDERFNRLLQSLSAMGYSTATYRVNAALLGVPQRRKRLIVISVRSLRVQLPDSFTDLLPASFDTAPVLVGDVFRNLVKSTRKTDPLNKFRASSPTVKARLQAIPESGNRYDLPEEHQLDCHRRLGRERSAGASYGRLKMDSLAPTMTTRCTTPACGSFVHPTAPRGITLREAAALQTFPSTYDFIGSYGSVERQIGNAVPVKMAEALGHAVQTGLALIPAGRAMG